MDTEKYSPPKYFQISRDVVSLIQSGKLPPENAQSVKATEVRGGKTAREIAEQKRINDLGGTKNLENKRNTIGERRRDLMGPQQEK